MERLITKGDNINYVIIAKKLGYSSNDPNHVDVAFEQIGNLRQPAYELAQETGSHLLAFGADQLELFCQNQLEDWDLLFTPYMNYHKENGANTDPRALLVLAWLAAFRAHTQTDPETISMVSGARDAIITDIFNSFEDQQVIFLSGGMFAFIGLLWLADYEGFRAVVDSHELPPED